MSVAYYNENDEITAAWLREAINAGLIAPGVVDTRSIVDVTPRDLDGFTQCHFFAGIGAWGYALRLAGWPDDRPVWTGSCPCQPFSSAGKGDGFDDDRHLWPHWYWLIAQRKPAVILGEQVEKAVAHGWLDLVQRDLEAIGYSVGHAAIPAGAVGAPHIRKRVWFVGHTDNPRLERHGQPESSGRRHGCERESAGSVGPTSITGDHFWSNADWLNFRDGKQRPVEPGSFPLAHGSPARVVRLRGYGNAIVPQVAQAFIEAYVAARRSIDEDEL